MQSFTTEYRRSLTSAVAQVCRMGQDEAEDIVSCVDKAMAASHVPAPLTPPADKAMNVKDTRGGEGDNRPTWALKVEDKRNSTVYGPEEYTCLAGIRDFLTLNPKPWSSLIREGRSR